MHPWKRIFQWRDKHRIIWWTVLSYLLFQCFTWPGAASAQSEDLFDVSFPNQQEGWACGRKGTVLHTNDGGQSWHRQTTGTRLTLTAIDMVSGKTGWAVGDMGIIIQTTDGGKHWEQQKSPVPYYLMGVHFVSPDKGWIVTERSHILHTRDGGQTWGIQFHQDDIILKDIGFANETTGWAVGEYGYVFHTKDSGKTWERQSGSKGFDEENMKIIGDPFLFDVEVVDALKVWAVGIDGHVTRTFNGGADWETVAVGAPRTHLFSVVSDKKNKVLIGGKRTFHTSSDKGQVWETTEFDPPNKYGWIYAITPRTESDFVCVGSGGMIYLGNALDQWVRAND